MKKTIYDATEIQQALNRMADSFPMSSTDAPWAVVGIRRGGEHLAARLATLLGQRVGAEIPVGYVDITLYRDDGFGPNDWPEVGVTEIPFPLKEHTIILVDDVLYTGRTVRAAIDAIIDYGRPKAIRLAVLVDRGLRELPFRADSAGFELKTTPNEHVDVLLSADGGEGDQVTVGPRGNGEEVQQ